MRRFLDPFRRAYAFLADVNWRSWYAHLGVSVLFTVAVRLAGPLALDWSNLALLVAGSTASLVGYIGKEIGDYFKHTGSGKWTPRKKEDGFGDVIGPFALWIGCLLAWLLG